MAVEKKQTDETPDANALIAQALTLLAANQPRKEIKEGDPEYVERQRKEGWFDTFADGVTVYQNAYEAQARGLSEEVRYRAAHLKPGSYLKNRVKVTVESDGAVVRLAYPVSGDNMLMNQSRWKDFSDLINQIWAEQHSPVPA